MDELKACQEGLKVKYNVFKVEDGGIVNNCFVLRPDKDPAAVDALRAYAASTDYFNVQYYRPGQSLSQPPVWSKTVYITNDVAGRDMVENLAASLTEHVANMEIPVGRKIVLTAERSLKI